MRVAWCVGGERRSGATFTRHVGAPPFGMRRRREALRLDELDSAVGRLRSSSVAGLHRQVRDRRGLDLFRASARGSRRRRGRRFVGARRARKRAACGRLDRNRRRCGGRHPTATPGDDNVRRTWTAACDVSTERSSRPAHEKRSRDGTRGLDVLRGATRTTATRRLTRRTDCDDEALFLNEAAMLCAEDSDCVAIRAPRHLRAARHSRHLQAWARRSSRRSDKTTVHRLSGGGDVAVTVRVVEPCDAAPRLSRRLGQRAARRPNIQGFGPRFVTPMEERVDGNDSLSSDEVRRRAAPRRSRIRSVTVVAAVAVVGRAVAAVAVVVVVVVRGHRGGSGGAARRRSSSSCAPPTRCAGSP